MEKELFTEFDKLVDMGFAMVRETDDKILFASLLNPCFWEYNKIISCFVISDHVGMGYGESIEQALKNYKVDNYLIDMDEWVPVKM